MLSTSAKKKQYWYVCKKHLNIILDGIDSNERLIIVRDGCYGDCEVENCYDDLVVKINAYPWFQIIQSTGEEWYRVYPFDIPDDQNVNMNFLQEDKVNFNVVNVVINSKR